MSPLRVAIVGFGKIARDQHVPAIAATDGVELVAIADPKASLPGVPHAAALDELLRDGPPIDAVALCTPPQVRHAQAAIALAAGKHVMLEKPPGATVAEITPLSAAARAAGRTLFTAWHSRYAPAVEPLRQMLAGRKINSIKITWKEDVILIVCSPISKLSVVNERSSDRAVTHQSKRSRVFQHSLDAECRSYHRRQTEARTI